MRPSAETRGSIAEAFLAGLLDPVHPTPEGLAGRGGPAHRRYDVYRNNVTFSLSGALADIFPATRRLVGEEFFAQIARHFVRAHPPVSPLLFAYGHGFPAFLDEFPPLRDFPYIPDVARLERAWLDAYHAADAAPLDPAALAAIDPDALAALRFAPHPATRIVRSRYAMHTIFLANREDADIATRIDADRPEDVLVARPGLSVTTERLDPGEAIFLGALADGVPFGGAAQAALEISGFDLGGAIGRALRSGAFTSIDRD